jgi:hypothetical protein
MNEKEFIFNVVIFPILIIVVILFIKVYSSKFKDAYSWGKSAVCGVTYVICFYLAMFLTFILINYFKN